MAQLPSWHQRHCELDAAVEAARQSLAMAEEVLQLAQDRLVRRADQTRERCARKRYCGDQEMLQEQTLASEHEAARPSLFRDEHDPEQVAWKRQRGLVLRGRQRPTDRPKVLRLSLHLCDRALEFDAQPPPPRLRPHGRLLSFTLRHPKDIRQIRPSRSPRP